MIVPRVADVFPLLNSLHPIHGLLLTEGEDIGLVNLTSSPTPAELEASKQHASDCTPDSSKDSIEFALVRRCLQHSIPILAICRGSQLVNVACGGTLHNDVVTALHSNVKHVDYDHYDSHRHRLHIVPNTPLSAWFDNETEIDVNSYHHQGIASLAHRFTPMAFAPDQLVEAYFDPEHYDIAAGRFIVGLQFHPERMQNMNKALCENGSPQFDYDGCVRPYRDFVAAAKAFQRRLTVTNLSSGVPSRVPKQRKRKLSRKEWIRLLEFGVTVHGACLVQNTLNATHTLDDCHAQLNQSKVDRWTFTQKLVKKLKDVEKSIVNLRSDGQVREIESLIEQLAFLTRSNQASNAPGTAVNSPSMCMSSYVA